VQGKAPSGQKSGDRVHGTGVELIIGVTMEQKVLLVEQYRIPVYARTIELPAGIVGDEPRDTRASVPFKSRSVATRAIWPWAPRINMLVMAAKLVWSYRPTNFCRFSG